MVAHPPPPIATVEAAALSATLQVAGAISLAATAAASIEKSTYAVATSAFEAAVAASLVSASAPSCLGHPAREWKEGSQF